MTACPYCLGYPCSHSPDSSPPPAPSPAKLRATVADTPRYVRSGRVLVVPCAPELAGEVALRLSVLTAFRAMYGDPMAVLWIGRAILVVLEEPPRYIGKARTVERVEVPGAALVQAVKKFNTDTIRRRRSTDD